jgi:hypothetical protein
MQLDEVGDGGSGDEPDADAGDEAPDQQPGRKSRTQLAGRMT